MTIDPDVRGVARQFTNAMEFASLAQAIVLAEGDILKAVRCSDKSITTRDAALRVLCRSMVHRQLGFIVDTEQQSAFVQYFGSFWAPIGAENDPNGLNKNWSPNVEKLWKALMNVKAGKAGIRSL